MRLLLILVLALYFGAASCSLIETSDARPVSRPAAETGTGSRTGARTLTGTPYHAIGMQIQRTDWIDKYKQSIDEIAEVGADTVKIVVDARQEDGKSNKIYLDLRMTPSAEQLGDLIRYAKSKGLRVIVMPIVLLDDPKNNEWRGTIEPENWDTWFDSYRDMLVHFAWISQGAGADVLVVGSELISTQSHEQQWRDTIAKVRGVFHGALTYSSNWDRYRAVPFWDALDFIGMNSYWKLGEGPDATVDEIVGRWKQIQSELLPWVREQGKPLMLTEVGWCSMSNAAHEPWDYTTGDPIDLDLQKRLYEGFFKAWDGVDELGGFSIWEWTPGDGGPNDRGYTPENKPAEDVLREQWKQPVDLDRQE